MQKSSADETSIGRVDETPFLKDWNIIRDFSTFLKLGSGAC